MPIRGGILVVVSVLISTLPNSSALAAPEYESLARCVPADVGLYIEGQRVDDLLLPLIEPQTWLALAELAGQPARVEEVAEWQAWLRQSLRMEPAEALRQLVAQQFAFVGEGLGRAQDGVVICRPSGEPRALLRSWAAAPLPSTGRVSAYRLADGIGTATSEGLLFFGAPDVPDGMFARVLKLAEEGARHPSLADDPVFQRLLARVPEQPDAVLFARLRRVQQNAASAPAASASAAGAARSFASTSAPASAPASAHAVRVADLPGPLAGASNVMLALHREQQLLRFSVVGDVPARCDGARTGLPELVGYLPERTLAAWGFHLDYQELPAMLERLPERSVLRLTFSMQERSGLISRLSDALDTATCVAVGVVSPHSRPVPAPPVPAVAVLVDAIMPEEAEDEFETLLRQSISLYGLMALKAGSEVVLPKVQRLEVEGADVGFVDISGLIPRPAAAVIAELHVCWGLDQGTLIVASHLDWMRQIIAARHGAATLQKVMALNSRPAPAGTENVIALQTGPLADLGTLWLEYFQKTAPEVLNESWWRARQRGRGNVHLGLSVAELPEDHRLRVTAVERDAPADGLLRAGDQIVGYSGDRAAPNVARRFATSQPIREMREALTNRPDARWVDLLIERAGTPLVKRIPLPYVDPIQALRRFVALGQVFQRLVYYEDAPEQPTGPEEGAADGPVAWPEPADGRGFLTIELRDGRGPLFPFAFTPSSAPTSNVAPQGR